MRLIAVGSEMLVLGGAGVVLLRRSVSAVGTTAIHCAFVGLGWYVALESRVPAVRVGGGVLEGNGDFERIAVVRVREEVSGIGR